MDFLANAFESVLKVSQGAGAPDCLLRGLVDAALHLSSVLLFVIEDAEQYLSIMIGVPRNSF